MELYLTSLTHSLAMAGDVFMVLVILGGVLWGCAAGALPGMNNSIAIGVMVPLTFGMPPIYAIAFLISISVGTAFGNSIPAILIGVPGTASAMLTAIDGYALHKQGKSGLALGVAYFSALSGQFLSSILFLALVVPLAGLAYVFLSPEMFAVYLLGSTAMVCITSTNILKGLASAALGLTISLVGRDPLSAVTRYGFDLPDLRMGIELLPVIVGFLAVSEILRSMRQTFEWGGGNTKFVAKFPPFRTLRSVVPQIFVGVGIGSFIGAAPGLGGTSAAIISYQQSKLWSKRPEEYGKGSIEGIAANESAQSADQAGELIPTFGLGIPGSGSMAILLGAMLMNGFIPGPQLISQAPQLLYASVCGLFVATIILALVGWWIARGLLKLVTFDRSLVLVGALCLSMIGVYTLNRSPFDVFLLLLFGYAGYFMLRYGFSTAGAAIGCVLGTGLERNLRGGLLLYDGDVWAFVSRPWTAGILMATVVLLVYGVMTTWKLAKSEKAARDAALARHLSRQQ